MSSPNNHADLSNIQTTCQLAFHGAAANSCPHSLQWVRAPPAPDTDDNAEDVSTQNNEPTVETVVYASSGVINLATSHNDTNNNITSVDQTLVTRTLDHASAPDTTNNKKLLARGEAVEDAAAARSVTALSWVDNDDNGSHIEGKNLKNLYGVVAAFSDGTVTSWRYTDNCWLEHVLIGHDPTSALAATSTCERHYEDGMDKSNLQESIADISTTNIDHDYGSTWLVATASSKGIFLHVSNVAGKEKEEMVYSRQIGHHAAASLTLQCPKNGGQNAKDVEGMRECYLFAGSASPRHNKVWVYTIPYSASSLDNNVAAAWVSLPLLTIGEPIYYGHLMGHQDWITCFSWLDQFVTHENTTERKESLLASSGHDAKIRLWKFSSYISSVKDGSGVIELGSDSDDLENSDDDEANIDDLEEEEGEARLVINHPSGRTTTAVSLEALMLGHEEAVTSLTWRQPTKKTSGDNKPCLLSSSMDRTILLWMEVSDDAPTATGGIGGTGGVWVPISRVGSAGGILGGSIGASLMGFVDATFSPLDANRIVGHGYGGSIHFWTQVPPEKKDMEINSEDVQEEDEDGGDLVTARWVADPCITGHFRSVVDMAWDTNGEYLLTMSSDQTTRLWTEVPVSKTKCRWVEVGRPQVHGYDLTSIVCIGGNDDDDAAMGGGEPRHRFVSGADEKVLRVFDAPASTLRMIRSIKQARAANNEDDTTEKNEQQPSSWRVERAFLPSLGLSNKATADTDQESSKFAGPTSNNDEEFAQTLDSVEGKSAVELKLPSERDLGVTTLWPETRTLFGHESELVCLDAYCAPLGADQSTIVASSCKARNDVASAAIRLWDCKKGKCVGILKGGHRSTVSTMSFSRNGKYLASSGKDRRICIWKRVNDPEDGTSYELSAAADSAHKRIVWSVHFCPKFPDILASGSRDGLVKVWRVMEAADGGLDLKELLRFEPSSKAGKNPITAVVFAEDILQGSDGQTHYGILSIGTESGRIEIWAVPISSNDDSVEQEVKPSPTLLCAVPSNDSHFDTVKKISWRPATYHKDVVNEGIVCLTLASCGQDNGVRIFKLKIRSP